MSKKRSKQPSQSSALKAAAVVGFLWLTSRLPLWLSRAIGRLFGRLTAFTGSAMAEVTQRNLQLCYPHKSDQEIRSLRDRSVADTGMLMMETSAIWMRDYAWIRRHILAVHNQDLLQEALDSEGGTMLLAPHMGNWEVIGPYMSEFAQVTILYQPPDMPELEPVIIKSREKVGAKLVPTNRKGVATLLKELKTGGLIGVLPDQVPDPSGGDFADFFGVPALTMTLIHSLMTRADCNVLATVAKRVPGGFEITFLPAHEALYSQDQQEALLGLNKTVEACVAIAPEQYQWEYKRFRKQPDGSNPYKVK